MARPKSEDPLLNISVRVPRSLRNRLVEESKTRGVTIADVFRSYIDIADAKPLGKPTPRKREKKLAAVSGCDPQLMRQLASIGSNLNQVAHTVNLAVLAGERISVLIYLGEIGQSLGVIARAEENRVRREMSRIPGAILSMEH